MKDLSILLLSLILIYSCKKEVAPNQNAETLGNFITYTLHSGTPDNSMIHTSDDNILICGNYNHEIILLKLDKEGNEIWQKDSLYTKDSGGYGLAEMDNGDIVICGHTSDSDPLVDEDILLIKTNSFGDTLWTRTYGGEGNERGVNIIACSDGNILVSSKSTSSELDDIHLIKISGNGDLIWDNYYSTSDNEVPYSLIETSDGDYLITCNSVYSINGFPFINPYFLKVNSSGNVLWENKLESDQNRHAYSTIELSNGDLLSCGDFLDGTSTQNYLVRTNSLGEILWEKNSGPIVDMDKLYALKENNDGSFVAVGENTNPNWETDLTTLNFDGDGNEIWYKKYGGAIGETGYNILIDINGDIIISGNVGGSLFITKLDKNGNFK